MQCICSWVYLALVMVWDSSMKPIWTGWTGSYSSCSCCSWWSWVSIVPVGKCSWCNCYRTCIKQREGSSSQGGWMPSCYNLFRRGLCCSCQWSNFRQWSWCGLWFCRKGHIWGNTSIDLTVHIKFHYLMFDYYFSIFFYLLFFVKA